MFILLEIWYPIKCYKLYPDFIAFALAPKCGLKKIPENMCFRGERFYQNVKGQNVPSNIFWVTAQMLVNCACSQMRFWIIHINRGIMLLRHGKLDIIYDNKIPCIYTFSIPLWWCRSYSRLTFYTTKPCGCSTICKPYNI